MTKLPTKQMIFQAYDADMCQLPAELMAARDALARIEHLIAEVQPPAVKADQHIARLAAELAERATRTAELDLDLSALDALREAERHHLDRQGVLTQARTIASQYLDGVCRDLASIVITDYLQPSALARIDAYRQAREVYLKHGADQTALFTAPPKAREAWVSSEACLAEYNLLRDTRVAWLRLTGNDAEPLDTYGLFSEVRNVEVVWPDVAVSAFNPHYHRAPWADQPTTRARIDMLLDLGAELWLPTVEQQNTRWREVFAERLQRAADNRMQLNAARHAFG